MTRREELTKLFLAVFSNGPSPKDFDTGGELRAYVDSCAEMAVSMQKALDSASFEKPTESQIISTVREALREKYGQGFEGAVIDGDIMAPCLCETCQRKREEN